MKAPEYDTTNERFMCDECVYDIGGCCDYDEPLGRYCVLGSGFKQKNKQISIFDILAPDEPKPDEPKTITYGYIKDFRIVGQELTFQDLKNYIRKPVVECKSTESNQYFRVYKVVEYYEDCDTYYKRVRPLPPNQIGYGEIVNSYIHDVIGIPECMECYEPAFTCDRVALSSNGKDKADSWISEAYCANGRFDCYLGTLADTCFFNII